MIRATGKPSEKKIPKLFTVSWPNLKPFITSLNMKKYDLIITIRTAVESTLSLIETIKELETETVYSIGSTKNVEVKETEILKSQLPNP
jgi:hypothetical protein